jgi:hypothetical protein
LAAVGLLSVSSSSSDVRSTTKVDVTFNLATGSGTAGADTVCVGLPTVSWHPAKMWDGSWAGAVTLTKLADPAVANSTDTVVAVTVSRFSGTTVCALMDTPATDNMTENSNYTVSVASLPTPHAASTSD